MDSRKNEKKPAEAGFLLCVRATGRRTTNTKAFRKRSLMDTGSLDGVVECAGAVGDPDPVGDHPTLDVERETALGGGERRGHIFNASVHVIEGKEIRGYCLKEFSFMQFDIR
jgi:hypothetical protein